MNVVLGWVKTNVISVIFFVVMIAALVSLPLVAKSLNDGVQKSVDDRVKQYKDLEKLEKKIAEHKLDPEVFKWYLDLRRYGSIPHGGFGLGLERTVAWICGTEHVRECIPFPRTIYRIDP